MNFAPLPGLRGVDHIGLVVPDLDDALALFVDVLGAQLLFTHGPYRGGTDRDLQRRQFDHHPRTEVERIAMLRVGAVNVELLQYSSPDQRTEVPRTSDLGGHHLALYVDDLPVAAEQLRAHGVRVLGAPMPLPGPESGPGNAFIFAKTGWGLTLELVSYRQGKAYESSTAARLYDPRDERLRGQS
ncbi:MAG: VOC family protein [Jatrophihabitantaceae bacterium]